LRDRLVLDLKKILIRLGQTAVFVTHDQTEALALADQVAVFNQGRLRRSGTPAELYRAPGDPFVARFLGLGNLIPGRIQGMGAETGIGYFPLDAPPDQGSAVWVILRAEGARMLEPDQTPGPDEVVVEGRAGVALFLGRGWRLGLTPAEGPDLTFELPLDQPPPRPGEPVRLALRRGHVIHCPWTNGGDGP
jgi:ABC-type Fe3+/spermidine/putrescine transport system ATPase subunit